MSTEITHVSPQDEMRILAMIVRGDQQKAIAAEFGLTEGTITNIKKRNPETLAMLKEQFTSHRVSQAVSILDKANKAIEKKLDDSELYDDKIAEIRQEFVEGVITEEERDARLRALQKLTVAELTSISREMHSQTKTEGPDKAPPMNAVEAQAYLIDLAKGLEVGDEIALERLVFTKKEA